MSQNPQIHSKANGIASRLAIPILEDVNPISESPGTPPTPLSAKEQITSYNGQFLNKYLEEGSQNIARINSRKNEDHLLQSLPDIRGESRPRTEPTTPFRTKSDTTIKQQENGAKSNALFPSSWLPGNMGNRKHKAKPTPTFSIEYTVFRPVSHMWRIENDADLKRHLLEVLLNDGYILEDGEWPENYINIESFNDMVSTMVYDVEHDPDLKPMRISQGSSGSYFIMAKTNCNSGAGSAYPYKTYKIGIFKPKDEEPYGPLSPKWSKWLHRTFFPCFFGRSCLIPNLGYISEAAACVLDRQLLLFIVPYTDIIHLKSSQFYYSFWERTRQKTNYKIGSFQCFLNGYVEANVFLKQHPFPHSLDDVPDDTFQLCHENDRQLPQFFWSKALICQFQDELEKLVILDYIMRNTDRGADNWMIKVEWVELGFDGILKKMSARLRIGAIDSGLAFPWKHPDEWRSFPFGWLFLPYYIIGRPFSQKTRKHFLPLLTSKYWWEQTTIKLKAVFQKDADFKERMWHKQIAVLKGQAFNVVEILKLQHAGPLELIRRENLLIWDDTMNVPSMVHSSSLNNAMDSSIYDVPPLNFGTDRNPSMEHSETTPLLKLSQPTTRSEPFNAKELSPSDSSKRNHMSGFDYNMSFKDRDCLCDGDEETNTKTVIIERLEKVYSKRPVFTWC